MRDQLNGGQKQVLEACRNVAKSDDGEFSVKWLRLAGSTFHASKLKELVDLGYLGVSYNGIVRRGAACIGLCE